MADVQNGIKINKENHGHIHVSKTLNENARKKQAFGELKNVLHNQHQSKPLKCPIRSETYSKHNPKYRIKPQTTLQNKDQVDQKNVVQSVLGILENVEVIQPQAVGAALVEERVELFKYLDIDRSCCAKPYKSDRQIWSENDMFDDSLIDKIMQSGINDDTETDLKTIEGEYGRDDSDSDDLLNFNNSILFSTSCDKEDFTPFLPLPPPLDLEDLPDFKDFHVGI